MTVAAAVELTGFGFRPAGGARWAVRGVDLRVDPGERVLLLGASGAGKSTVLRAMAGLLDAGGAVAGTVEVDGGPAVGARHRVGLLLQDPDAGLVLSRAGEDVAFGPQNRGVPPAEVGRRVSEALRQVRFPYGRDHPIAALSGGERQRLALAGVLAMRPALLLLDEPTSMLDPVGAEAVRDAVGRMASETGCTVVVVEHNTQVWDDLVDRVVVLSDQGVTADGSLASVRRSPAANGTWLVEPPSLPSVPVETSTSNEVLLTAVRVGMQYQVARRWALRGTTLDLRGGSTLAIVGVNGSGKSTLARLLGGLVAPTTGAVSATSALTRGADIGDVPVRWRAATLAGRIGSVFQNPEHAFLADSVRDELAVGPLALGRARASVAAMVDELLARLRLDAVADQNPFTLSGGEQRRLSVAAAIATSPRVLVLDEPTFGQDPATWRETVRLVTQLRADGAALAVATHDTRFLAAVADRHLQLAPPDGDA